MSRIKDFFLSLNKSTKLTILSCGCFIVMTLIILCIFVFCPITPSEKAISSLGREGLVYQESDVEPVTTVSTTTTTGTATQSVTTTSNTTSGFIGAHVTTLGTDYVSGNIIPTGSYAPTVNQTTTTTSSPENYIPPVTTSTTFSEDPHITTSATDIDVPITSTEPEQPPTEPTEPTEAPTEPTVEPTQPQVGGDEPTEE